MVAKFSRKGARVVACGSRHSLVQTTEDVYALPPLSTVTLEEIKEAGEWEANGRRVRRRLFVVGVSYRIR